MGYNKDYHQIAQRDWDELMREDSQPAIYNCIYCLDYGDNDGEPCSCKEGQDG